MSNFGDFTQETSPTVSQFAVGYDTATSGGERRTLWSAIRALFKTYYDTVYAAISHTHAQSDITSLVSDLAAKAPLASPAFTGNPTVPTQAPGNNSTRAASTAYVDAAVTAGVSGVASVNTRTGAVTLDKTDVGLGNVDNTSDANKPVSTAQSTAIGLKLTTSLNLSDVPNPSTARTNLGLGTAATQSTGTFAQVANNLSDLSTPATALANLQALFASRVTKTSSYTVVAGDKGKLIDSTSGTFSLSLTAAATLGSSFYFAVFNSGTGVLTIDPNGSETIRDAVSSATTKTFSQGEGGLIYCDGTGFILFKFASAAGDVTGPASSTSGNIPVFSGTSGKVLSDSGVAPLSTTTTSAGSGDVGKAALLDASGQHDVSTAKTTALADHVSIAEVDVASATTTDIGAASSINVRITGTTTITGLGTVTAGTRRFCRFSGALTFTHNATSLILPSGANISTAAGDRFIARSLGSGNWLVESYTKADGTALAGSGGGSGDIVSTLVNSAVTITADTTLDSTYFGKVVYLNPTSANITITLAAVSGNAGKHIQFVMLRTATKLATLDGNASETIDGATTRILWRGETALLEVTSSEYIKISGRTIPMRCVMSLSANMSGQTSGNDIKITIDTINDDTVPAMGDTTNNKITFLRGGTYTVTPMVKWVSMTQNAARVITATEKNGVGTFLTQAEMPASVGTYPTPSVASPNVYVATDYIELHAFQNSGANQVPAGSGSPADSFLSVLEIPTW